MVIDAALDRKLSLHRLPLAYQPLVPAGAREVCCFSQEHICGRCATLLVVQSLKSVITCYRSLIAECAHVMKQAVDRDYASDENCSRHYDLWRCFRPEANCRSKHPCPEVGRGRRASCACLLCSNKPHRKWRTRLRWSRWQRGRLRRRARRWLQWQRW